MREEFSSYDLVRERCIQQVKEKGVCWGEGQGMFGRGQDPDQYL